MKTKGLIHREYLNYDLDFNLAPKFQNVLVEFSKYQYRKPRELGEMVRIFLILISGQGFNSRSGYEAALKLMVNVYPLMALQNEED